jgi:hypothetical protein
MNNDNIFFLISCCCYLLVVGTVTVITGIIFYRQSLTTTTPEPAPPPVSEPAPAPAPPVVPAIFTSKNITCPDNVPNSTLFLDYYQQGDNMYWQNSTTSNSTKWTLDSQGRLSPSMIFNSQEGLTQFSTLTYVCFDPKNTVSNLTLSSTLTPIIFNLNSSNNLVISVGNLLGKGLNGSGSGSWPFILSPLQVSQGNNAAAIVNL